MIPNLEDGIMTHTCKVFVAAVVAIGLLILAGSGLAQNTGDSLEKGFVDPPNAARPRVWWHWTGGNITKEGITKDLEWMKRAGIGGAQMADIGFEGGQIVQTRSSSLLRNGLTLSGTQPPNRTGSDWKCRSSAPRAGA